MNVHRCDACGDEYLLKNGAAQAAVQLRAPKAEQAGDGDNAFLMKLMGRESREEETYTFDLCYECGLAMAVALKKQRADLKAGRRPV